MDRLNVAVLGLGLGRIFSAAFAESAAVARLVVCDSDHARVESVRAAVPRVAAGYPNLEAMLDAEKPDAVCIVTPDQLHRPHAERCLAAGCHVLLTKPLACTLADGRAIVRAAEAAGRTLMVAHERRFRPAALAMHRMIQAGELGEIIHLRADQITDRREHFRRSPWYASPEAGRTALVGSGIHEVDLVRYLIGRPIASVSAYSNRLGTLEFPTHKTTTALFEFVGGAIAEVTVTYEAHWPKAGPLSDDFRLVASRGIIVGSRVARDGRDAWEELPHEEQPMAQGTHGCVHAFLRTLVEGAAVAVSGRDAFASLAAAVAADESAATGAKTVPAPADFD